ncbi:hypothetical protein LZ554_007138 [Drepanopeziza brunnea f. sp. 'monogermtubi']|nr:hypothetical protein LZ554_007138 [Drepanopeziza brunnea f. sp. 'monogermtubi']
MAGPDLNSRTSSKSSSYRSQKATARDLSLLEKLGVGTALVATLTNALIALFTGVWYAKERRPESYYRYVVLAGIRTFIEKLTPRQQHYVNPPTDDAYRAICKKRGQQPSSEVLSDGTLAHWIGKPHASKLLINFHGGGFVMPASEHMVEFMFQVVGVLEREGKDASCLFLSYDLAPGAIYPRQLQQAASLLNHVLHTLHYAPSSIVISGDSAGAHLCVALLSHISHPHPSASLPIPAVTLPEKQKFKGIVLISPWLSFDTAARSYAENAWKDCVSIPSGTAWSTAFLGSPWPHHDVKDRYNEALSAPPEWWTGLPVSEMLIVCGKEEVLRDSIVAFAAKVRAGTEGAADDAMSLEFHVLDGEYHDQPNLDLQIGYAEKDEGATAKMVKSWVASKI